MTDTTPEALTERLGGRDERTRYKLEKVEKHDSAMTEAINGETLAALTCNQTGAPKVLLNKSCSQVSRPSRVSINGLFGTPKSFHPKALRSPPKWMTYLSPDYTNENRVSSLPPTQVPLPFHIKYTQDISGGNHASTATVIKSFPTDLEYRLSSDHSQPVSATLKSNPSFDTRSSLFFRALPPTMPPSIGFSRKPQVFNTPATRNRGVASVSRPSPYTTSFTQAQSSSSPTKSNLDRSHRELLERSKPNETDRDISSLQDLNATNDFTCKKSTTSSINQRHYTIPINSHDKAHHNLYTGETRSYSYEQLLRSDGTILAKTWAQVQPSNHSYMTQGFKPSPALSDRKLSVESILSRQVGQSNPSDQIDSLVMLPGLTPTSSCAMGSKENITAPRPEFLHSLSLLFSTRRPAPHSPPSKHHKMICGSCTISTTDLENGTGSSAIRHYINCLQACEDCGRSFEGPKEDDSLVGERTSKALGKGL